MGGPRAPLHLVRWAFRGLETILALIGLGGLSDDLAQWKTWLSFLDHEAARWMFVLIAVGTFFLTERRWSPTKTANFLADRFPRLFYWTPSLMVVGGVAILAYLAVASLRSAPGFEEPPMHFPNNEHHEITPADVGKTFQIGECPSSWCLNVEIEQIDWSASPPKLPLAITEGTWGRIRIEPGGRLRFPLPLVQHCRGGFGVRARSGRTYSFEFYVRDERPMTMLIDALTYVDESPNKLGHDCLDYIELVEPNDAGKN